MEIITGEDFDLSDSIKELAHETAESIYHIAGQEHEVSFFLKKENKDFEVVIELPTKEGKVVGKSTEAVFSQAMHHARDKVLRQLRDIKEKKITRRHH